MTKFSLAMLIAAIFIPISNVSAATEPPSCLQSVVESALEATHLALSDLSGRQYDFLTQRARTICSELGGEEIAPRARPVVSGRCRARHALNFLLCAFISHPYDCNMTSTCFWDYQN